LRLYRILLLSPAMSVQDIWHEFRTALYCANLACCLRICNILILELIQDYPFGD